MVGEGTKITSLPTDELLARDKPAQDRQYSQKTHGQSGSNTNELQGDYFVFTVETTTPDETFTLPLASGGTYNFDVGFQNSLGAGTFDYTITAYNQAEATFTYPSAGTHTIWIRGTMQGWAFQNTGSRNKMREIIQWGGFEFYRSETFYGCQNMTVTATDVPTIGAVTFKTNFRSCNALVSFPSSASWDMSQVTSLRECFENTNLFNDPGIASWDVSSVTSLQDFMGSTGAFDQDLSSWDLSSCTVIRDAFKNCTTFTNGGVPLTWTTTGLLADIRGCFNGATSFDGSGLDTWIITGLNASQTTFANGVTFSTANYNAILNAWEAQVEPTGITINFGNSQYDYTALDARDTLVTTSTWSITDGGRATTDRWIFEVTTTGAAEDFTLPIANRGQTLNFDIDWGDTNTSTITAYNDADLTHNYTVANTYTVTCTPNDGNTISGIKFGNDAIMADKVGDISQWGAFDISGLETFDDAANLTCSAADAPIVSGTSMEGTFRNCASLATLGTGAALWDMSGVTDMERMFSSDALFDDDLSAWDVSGVTTFQSCFLGCSVFTNGGQPLTWTTTSMTTMHTMLQGCDLFNQPLPNLDVSVCTSTYRAFNNCDIFNQDLSHLVFGVNVSLAEMFRSCFAYNNGGVALTWGGTSFITSLKETFITCSVFNADVSSWDTSNVTTMEGTFRNCSAYDRDDAASWDITSITTAADMFNGVTLSTANYNAILEAWEAQVEPTGIVFGGGSSKHSGAGTVARGVLATTSTWTITDGGAADTDAFLTTWTTTGAAETVTIPLVSAGTLNFDIDWGDGNVDTITAYNDSALAHEYATADTYVVEMTPNDVNTLTGWKFNNGGDKAKIKSIAQWGFFDISEPATFYGCSAAAITATDSPAVTSTDFTNQFRAMEVMNGNLSGMDVSSVTKFNNCFNDCFAWDNGGSALDWTTTAATTFSGMFVDCTVFNQALPNFDLNGVLSCRDMFWKAAAFDQDITGWVMTSVTDIVAMFRNASAFNQAIGVWDVSGCSNFGSTFANAVAFDQDIGAWDITGLTAATSMFSGVTLSTANYNALLTGWEAQLELTGVTFHGGNSTHSGAGTTARGVLTGTSSWSITDGGAA